MSDVLQREIINQVLVLTINNPPVNALSKAVRIALIEAFDKAANDSSISAVVLTGAGREFVAGADIHEMKTEPERPYLPEVMDALERCDKPIIAALNGSALGGGYELALVCDARMASPKAMIGLTETKLGLIPGAGGTQRLMRLVGAEKAADLIAGGKRLNAQDALEAGLIDVVAQDDVMQGAVARAKTTAKRRLSQQRVPAFDQAAYAAMAAQAHKKARGVPAIGKVLDLIEKTASMNFADGLKLERELFLGLRQSLEAKALRYLFFAEREASKVQGLEGVQPRTFENIAVIGAGTMGAGIAVALADSGLMANVIERDAASADAGLQRINGIYEKQAASGRITPEQRNERLTRIHVSEDWQKLREADLIIEAVFEDMDIKTDVFRRMDELARDGAVIATNTSYLDINALAATTKRPQDVVGLHFFSPANVMRLLEVVRCEKTAPDVLATGLALAKKIGKTAIVAGVCDGFVGNRIYAVYRREVEYLLEDGATPLEIDQALEAFGFAMGPFAVFDLSGLDIAWARRKRLAATRDPNERYVNIPDILCERGWLGRKTGRGYYRYDSGKPQPDSEVLEIIEAERNRKGITPRMIAADEIVRRVLRAMAQEGQAALAEGIAQRASDIDLALVNGYGFPNIKGGPMFLAAEGL